MSSYLRTRRTETSVANSSDRVRAEVALAQDKIRSLKQLVMELQRELESLNQVPTPTVEKGIDFYTEVSNFEIEMIKRALRFTEGHQGKAARLLNLNMSTLGSMIKRYYIQVGPTALTGTKHSNQNHSLTHESGKTSLSRFAERPEVTQQLPSE